MIDPKYLEILACPRCRGDLSIAADSLQCAPCGRNFAVEGGIPILIDNADQA